MNTSINSGSSSSEHNLIMSWIGAADKKINMIIYDTEGTVKFITTSYAQRFNSPSWETMIGRKLSDSIPADDTELQSFVAQLETIRQKVVQDKKTLQIYYHRNEQCWFRCIYGIPLPDSIERWDGAGIPINQ